MLEYLFKCKKILNDTHLMTEFSFQARFLFYQRRCHFPQWSIFHFGNNLFSHKTLHDNTWMYTPFLSIIPPPCQGQRAKVKACSGPIESRAWGRQPPLHTIRMKHKNWESLHSNSVHLCITYPLFVCYRLTQWSFANFLSTRRGLLELMLASRHQGLAYKYLACLKWCSKGPLCLTQFFFFVVVLSLKLGRNETAQEWKKEQRAIDKMKNENSLQFLQAFHLYQNAK